MRVVLLARTGRPSAPAILRRLVSADKEVVAVIAEKRSSLLLKKGFFSFVGNAIQTHGFTYLFQKALDTALAGFRPKEEDLDELCRRFGIPYRITPDHNSAETVARLKDLSPDILITANTRIIKKRILDIPARAALNFHTSKLPQYAGLESIFWALYHGEREIGVTVHFLEPGLDTGDIFCQGVIPVGPGATVESLTEEAIRVGAGLMVEAVEKLEQGDNKGIAQDLAQRTYFSWPGPAQRRELARRLARHKA